MDGLTLSPSGKLAEVLEMIRLGGPSIWAIAALSVLTLALILWKVWRLVRGGAWAGQASADRALGMWASGNGPEAVRSLVGRRAYGPQLVRAAMLARQDTSLTDDAAREETERVARQMLADLRSGLRPLELIATIAPLLGLLGTVLGMISAFQTLQEAGGAADPSMLAGGIWEALLTTAAGMAVAIPASVALTWFEAVADRVRLQLEDGATRVFLRTDAIAAE
ncbi:MotA/TolQ/ExbB proton channel family protein [Donghicola sp. B5-SW-15]|uniref:MotA/TolQ/ExbB proton channel family protein n=1 Tax=Donghicola mangrovi TaxID=2729614 RepID=A0A850QFM7_9RHOB|nr:MotA/TolQ/ExbB proton channel family protein [Donghicola mangrovi]NVO25185.1 MotA/TolQ/ExbB proton channel family protein [Donghicola mangrovi]